VFRQAARRVGSSVRRGGWADLGRVWRLTAAAVAAYVVALLLPATALPILAPLTALLVVQVTLVGSVRSSVDRVASVVAGVLVASAFAEWVGFRWWSLGLLIAASLLLGQLLRLGDNLLEVPISAMIVLGAGARDVAAVDRVLETLIGAGVGVAVNLAVPPRVRVRDAAAAVETLAFDMAAVVERTAHGVRRGLSLEQANQLAEEARGFGEQVLHTDRVLVEAEESAKLNPRAMSDPAQGSTLRSGLDVLEHTAVALRGLYRSIADLVARREAEQTGYSEEARAALAELLIDVAGALRAYGRLLEAEVVGGVEPRESELATMLESVREARARLTELFLVDPAAGGSSWEINGAILTSIERVLRELDPEERARVRRRVEESRLRSASAVAVDRIRSATRQVTKVPVASVRRVGWRRGPKEPR